MASNLPIVETATLELASEPLHEQIYHLAQSLVESGCRELCIVPLFLLPGVHVMDDIPEQVAIAQSRLSNTMLLRCRPYLGSHPKLAQHLLPCSTTPGSATILVSHGSRRHGGNAPVEAIAAQMGAVLAYWSVEPNLETQVGRLVALGHQHITVVPYFLFPGGITDAIAATVAQLIGQFPTIEFTLTDPLGDSAHLIECVIDLLQPALTIDSP